MPDPDSADTSEEQGPTTYVAEDGGATAEIHVHDVEGETLAVGAYVAEAFEAEDVDEAFLTTPIVSRESVVDTRNAIRVGDRLTDVDPRHGDGAPAPLGDVDRVTMAAVPDDVAARNVAALDALDGVEVATAVEGYPDIADADHGGRHGPRGPWERVRLGAKRAIDALVAPEPTDPADVEHRTEGDGWSVEALRQDWDHRANYAVVAVGDAVQVTGHPPETVVEEAVAETDATAVYGTDAVDVGGEDDRIVDSEVDVETPAREPDGNHR